MVCRIVVASSMASFYSQVLLPKLKAKPVRTASGVSVAFSFNKFNVTALVNSFLGILLFGNHIHRCKGLWSLVFFLNDCCNAQVWRTFHNDVFHFHSTIRFCSGTSEYDWFVLNWTCSIKLVVHSNTSFCLRVGELECAKLFINGIVIKFALRNNIY